MPQIVKIHVTSDFEKAFRKIPHQIQILAEKKDKWFRANSFDARLRTHQLRGELKGFWSYSINYHFRILFRFIQHDEVVYYDIGTHQIYR
jgi:addiction module RelE/StbE family toxin